MPKPTGRQERALKGNVQSTRKSTTRNVNPEKKNITGVSLKSMTEGTGVEGVPSYEKLNLGETLPVEEQSILTRRNNSVESKKYLDNLKNTVNI